jgi:hypothetical protein
MHFVSVNWLEKLLRTHDEVIVVRMAAWTCAASLAPQCYPFTLRSQVSGKMP